MRAFSILALLISFQAFAAYLDLPAASGGGSGVTSVGSFGSAPNSGGASISTTTLTLQPADATHPGGVATGAQTLAGQKKVQAQASGDIPLKVQGAASQSGDLLQFLDNTPTVLSAFASNGGLLLGTDTQVSPPAAAIIAQNSSTDTGLLFEDYNGNYFSIEDHPNHLILEAKGGNAYTWWNGPNAAAGANWAGYGPGTHNPVYPLDFNFPSNAATNVASISSITPNNGTLFPPVIMIDNLNTTAGTIAGVCSAGQSEYPMNCMISHHATNPSAHGTEASTVEFANMNAGTLTDYMNVSSSQMIQFNAYGTGIAAFDSTGHLSSTTTPAIGAATGTSLGVVAASGTNIAGTALAVSGGQSTGTGVGGAITFSTSPAGSTGSSVNALSQIAQVGSKGVGIFSTANDVALHIKQQGIDDTGIVLEDTNNTKKLAINGASANMFSMEMVGGNYFWAVGNGTSSAAPTNWQGWSDGGANPTLKWPWGYEVSSVNGNVTSFSTYTPANGAAVNGYPIAVFVNRNSTLNTLMELCTADASFGLTACFGHRSIDQTTNANKAEATIATADGSGHVTEKIRVEPKGQVNYGGAAPTLTCGGSATVAGNDDVGRVTVGTSPGTTCTVTFAAAWTNAPHCDATDETAAAGAGVVIPGVATTTAVVFTYASLAASDKISYHCTGYF